MAAWIPKSITRVPKRYNVCATSYGIQGCDYSSEPRVIKNPTTAKLKRGTGGRSSFNGIVCTIFGNTGYIGRHICSRLGNAGTQLILPYRGEHYFSMRLKLCGDLGQVLYHPFHLEDEESLARCVKYSNVVVNLIGQNYETRNFTFEKVHVDGMRRLARICKENNVERLVHVTNINAGPDLPKLVTEKGSRFLQTKWEGECVIRDEFPDATIIRVADAFGYGDRFVGNYLSSARYFFGKLPLWKMGEETIKYPVSVTDVGAGIAAIVTDPKTKGETYQFIGPQRYKLSDLTTWFNALAVDGPSDVEIVDLQKFFPFKWFVNLWEFAHPKAHMTYVNWESIEREHHSDIVRSDLPTLEDLGVCLTPIEDEIPHAVQLSMRLKPSVEYERIFNPVPPPRASPIV